MANYRIDKTAFKHQSFEEEERSKVFQKVAYTEQLRTATYLISIAYGFVGKPFPKMDKTAFSIRKQS